MTWPFFLKIINERHIPGSKHYIEHAATYTVYFEKVLQISVPLNEPEISTIKDSTGLDIYPEASCK